MDKSKTYGDSLHIEITNMEPEGSRDYTKVFCLHLPKVNLISALLQVQNRISLCTYHHIVLENT